MVPVPDAVKAEVDGGGSEKEGLSAPERGAVSRGSTALPSTHIVISLIHSLRTMPLDP